MSPSPNYQFYTEQALRIHGKDRFWYHVITVVLKNGTEQLFHGDIFSLRGPFTEIHHFSTRILNPLSPNSV